MRDRGFRRCAKEIVHFDEWSPLEVVEIDTLCERLNDDDDAGDPTRELVEALEALVEWGCTQTSPLDPNTPHGLLVLGRTVLAKANQSRVTGKSDDVPNACAECARSFGPHYRGRCEH